MVAGAVVWTRRVWGLGFGVSGFVMLVQHRELYGLRVSDKTLYTIIRVYTDLFWGLYGFVRVDCRGVKAGFEGGCAADGTFPRIRMPRTVRV